MQMPDASRLFETISQRRRIGWLAALKWVVFPLLPLAVMAISGMTLKNLLFGLVCGTSWLALRAWELSERRRFIREAGLPRFLGAKLRAHYPQLSASDADLVLCGLRQFFMAHLRAKRTFVAMPSRVVDQVWHEFILHTRGYQAWCEAAFGTLMHHTPAEVLSGDPRRNDGLRRCWYWACKEESIDPRAPTRLPLLFALDRKFAIEGGFAYVPDCGDINRQSSSGAHCGSSFSDDSHSGSADTFGGAEAGSASGGDGDGGGDGGGCGGD